MDSFIYPLTIVYDRYMGTYSGGRWTAWCVDADLIPEAIHSDDISCSEFWSKEAKHYHIGKGDSPEEAVRNLEKMLRP